MSEARRIAHEGIHCNPRSHPLHLPKAITLQYKIEATFLQSFYNGRNRCWPTIRQIAPKKKQVVKDKGSLNPTSPPSKGWFPVSTTDFNRFPFNNFTYCLTLFSKFFSSFPHGTCSLSVSRLYLALGEIYLPFWAAIPNNSTLRKRIVMHIWLGRTGFSPSMIPYPKGFGLNQTRRKRFFKLQLG